MSLFAKLKKNPAPTAQQPTAIPGLVSNGVSNGSASLADVVLNSLHDGIIMIDSGRVIRFVNPAAVTMAGLSSVAATIGLDYGVVIHLESKDGRPLDNNENPLLHAISTGQPLDSYECLLIIGQTNKRLPVCISALPVQQGGFVITFRDITKELEAGSEQADFISTASHEMRTPVASIEGYLSLALNPQTATIDARAKGYLEAAHAASKHLGKLFQDLLDVTKLDDGHIRPEFMPIEVNSFIGELMNSYLPQAANANIHLVFGTDNPSGANDSRRLEQVLYAYPDPNFLHEIMDNLIDNALKYTPAGGTVSVNVSGDVDRVLISVTDTGKGISATDLGHIFQKFYRVDNSDTRTIGGTGLGLYIVKQRAEAMGGRVWAESTLGSGSTFYISLPRISADEYEKRMIPFRNQMMTAGAQPVSPTQATGFANPSVAAPAPSPAPVAPPTPQPPEPAPTVQPTPPAPPTSQPSEPVPTPQPVVPSQPTPMSPVQPSNNNLNGETQ